MTGGNESAAGDKDGGSTLSAQVPVGWQRRVEDRAVVYVSPSGTVLCSVEEVRGYLLTDSTCKCGLECPLVLHKVFNFDPAAAAHAPSHESRKVEEDMTKLCNHRRKVVAMAALCRSMQTAQLPLLAHGAGNVLCSVDGRDQRGSVLARGDVVHCTYPTQPRPSSGSSFPLPSPLSLLQNGSVSHPASTLTPDQSPPLKKPPLPGKQQWSPRPAVAQTVLQRAPHKPPSPRQDPHAHVYQLDAAVLPASFSSPCSSPSPVGGRAGLPQGVVVVKSPSPLSVCSSPSRALDSFSSPQRSRHSSTSSLSEGAPGAGPSLGVKPPPSPLPCSSPKLPRPPSSPRARLEGLLQHYKDCGAPGSAPNFSSAPGVSSAQHHAVLGNQSGSRGPQNPTPAHHGPCERRNGPGSGPSPGLLGLPLGQILCQQKNQQQQQHMSSSFPASSLLSAAAKAQLASQKGHGQPGTEAVAAVPLAGLDKDQQSKVLISTLSTSLHGPAGRAPPLTAFLLPHAPSLPVTPPALEKTLRRKRQRRSPTVLSMLKESQMSRAAADPAAPALPSAPAPRSENHPQGARLPPSPGGVPRHPDLEEGKRAALGASLPLSSGPASSSQPLSALLQLLSMQSAQSAVQSQAAATGRPDPGLPSPPRYDGQPGRRTHTQVPPSARDPIAQSRSLMPEEADGGAVNLKTTASVAALNLSRPHAGGTAGVAPPLCSQAQLPSATGPEKGCGSRLTETVHDHVYQPNHRQAAESPVIAEQQDVDARLFAEPGLALPPAPPPPDLPGSPSDPSGTLQLAESFPFMTQEQLLQLLTSTAGLPSLLPPFLGSLPLGLCAGAQPPGTGGAQTPQPTNSLLGQAPPLGLLPSSIGAHGEFPLNLVSLLNTPAPGPPLAPPPAPPPGLEVCEKPPGLQALLMASLLLGQNPAAVLPLPGLNLELPPQQQVFGEGVSLEKSPALLDSVLMGPGLLEALQALVPAADGQSLLLSAQLTPPPPPAFLSLNPALLAAALAQADSLPGHTPSPPPHTQGTLPNPALVSTSVSCASLVPVSGQEVCDSLTEQEKTGAQTPQFLPPLLPPGVLGDMAALGNINSLHSLLGAGPLLLQQASSLGVTLPQNPGALNPLTCLQLSMAPALMEEKPLALHESSPAQEDLPPAQLPQDSLLNPGHVQTPGQQREGPAGADPGLLDPYTSFMDTIYTSFLQVSGRGSEAAADSAPLSYPELPPLLQQPSAPPSLSPRRAFSVHNPDLTRLGMEAAQSPARGTPKLTENPSTPPPSRPARADACPADGPLQLTFMEEAKTDGSAKPCVYSNGLGSGAGPGADDDEEEDEEDEEDEEERQPQGFLSPRERGSNEAAVDTVCGTDTQHGRAAEIRTGARRGRKRKQTLQRGSEIPGDIGSIIEEPSATTGLPRPARAARGKRRRVVR
ncbi:uncharacterized protein mbd6 [Brachyhypopomus gauderio]|uniref:uncharacterized protein mbd6 n=1 Tax=Brachyhypopomus gauderio TaxID=698409 RepID=UPI004042EC5B